MGFLNLSGARPRLGGACPLFACRLFNFCVILLTTIFLFAKMNNEEYFLRSFNLNLLFLKTNYEQRTC